MDKTGVSMIGHGTFLVQSADIVSKERYTIDFGDDNNMPSCSCPSWKEFFYPCKHFFCVFEKYPLWGWEALSSLYRNSPFLSLDLEGKTMNQTNNQGNSCNKDVPVTDDSEEEEINHNNNSIKTKNIQKVSARDCRELLSRMKNLTFDVDEESTVFDEVQALLLSAVELLEKSTKKENGITVAPVKRKEKSDLKRKYLDLKRKKNKRIKRYGYASCKKERYSEVHIENQTKHSFKNEIVEEEVVCDNFDMEGIEEFKANIPLTQVFNESDSEVEEENSPRCTISFADLKLISNRSMLNDTVIHAAQNMLQLQFPNAMGLQDPVLGQLSAFNVHQNRPFVQILHDGNAHWVAISTIGCGHGEVVLMDSMFHGRVNAKVKKQICEILRCSLDKILIKALPVVQQSNGIDCGIFAIAFIEYLLRTNQYPTEVNFDTRQLRNHLLKCFKDNHISMFPLSEKTARRNKAKEFELEIHCSCRMVWLPSDANIYGK